MAQLSPGQVRVVDPVLTNVAQGFKQAGFVGDALFPMVPVSQRAGNIITFGKEDFMLYNTARAPGEATKRVQFGHTGSQFSLVDYSLEAVVPVENYQEGMSAANGWTIDMMKVGLNKVDAIMKLRLEYAQAQIARATGNYGAGNKVTLSGTAQWSDYSGTSNPFSVVSTAKEAIRAATGKRPNTLVMGAQVFEKLKAHPLITARLIPTGRDIASEELLASLFGVQKVLVGDAIYASDAGVFSDVWGKDVVLAYTETASVADMGTPTYGYTYNLGGYPIVETPYMDRNAKSWIAPVSRAEAAVIASATAGYLITNAVA